MDPEMETTTACRACRYFSPKRFQLGECMRQDYPGAKLFSINDSKLLVHPTHYCTQYEPVPAVEKETL